MDLVSYTSCAGCLKAAMKDNVTCSFTLHNAMEATVPMLAPYPQPHALGVDLYPMSLALQVAVDTPNSMPAAQYASPLAAGARSA